MTKNFFVNTEHLENSKNYKNNLIEITNDNIVNDFVNKKISLETLIEKKLYKIDL